MKNQVIKRRVKILSPQDYETVVEYLVQSDVPMHKITTAHKVMEILNAAETIEITINNQITNK